jgi:hypothetical protein
VIALPRGSEPINASAGVSKSRELRGNRIEKKLLSVLAVWRTIEAAEILHMPHRSPARHHQ